VPGLKQRPPGDPVGMGRLEDIGSPLGAIAEHLPEEVPGRFPGAWLLELGLVRQDPADDGLNVQPRDQLGLPHELAPVLGRSSIAKASGAAFGARLFFGETTYFRPGSRGSLATSSTTRTAAV
jgi:hypothetical protein